jgi:hypothetical protein
MIYIPPTFFTGAPGSKWSGVAQEIEEQGNYDTSDRTPAREYTHSAYSGHLGAYFGTGMEFPPELDIATLHRPFAAEQTGPRLIKSHEWSTQLNKIVDRFPSSKIIMVHRPDHLCYEWWMQAGGWSITYPDYKYYVDDNVMKFKIAEQNRAMLDFAQKHSVQWVQHHKLSDVSIGTYKGN